MSVEVHPTGVACNLACPYCYQEPMRQGGNAVRGAPDLDAMIRGLEAENSSFTVFGGEPLLADIGTLDRLFKFGFDRWKRNAVQTNGTRITDAHVSLFRRYNVHVGFSLDGPVELNDTRWAGSVEKTRAATAISQAAIERLLSEGGIATSLICTIHKGNATADKLPRLKDWLYDLDRRGLKSMRLHALETETPEIAEALQLDPPDLVRAFLDLRDFEKKLGTLRFDVFGELRKLLLGDDRTATCIWQSCDPWTTSAVRGIDNDGSSINCGRTNKEGVNFTKADVQAFTRQVVLHRTPQADGGCRDCRFFLQCRGQCPGTAIDGDWRNRTANCSLWMALLEQQERELLEEGIIPMSVSPFRREAERAMLRGWEAGKRPSMYHTFRALEAGRTPTAATLEGQGQEHGDEHGDHYDAEEAAGHGDVPHGDLHEDHNDDAAAAAASDRDVEHGDVPHGDHTDEG